MMLRYAVAVLATLATAPATATEVLLCDAVLNTTFGGDPLKINYAYSFSIDEKSGFLVIVDEKERPMSPVIAAPAYPFSGKVTIRQEWRGVLDEKQAEFSGFATRLPSTKGGNSFVGTAFFELSGVYPVSFRADVWDEGRPFYVLDGTENAEAVGSCR